MDYTEFAAAGSAADEDDRLVELDAYVVSARDVIRRTSRIYAEFAQSSSGGPSFGLDLASDFSSRVISHASGVVRTVLIAPTGLQIDPMEVIEKSLGVRAGQDILDAWKPGLIRPYFERRYSDLRQCRIDQLRGEVKSLFLKSNSYDRPTEKFYMGGEYHSDSYDSYRSKRKTYRSENIHAFENVLRYAIHLTNGSDPIEIQIPKIFGWNDGDDKWAPANLYKRQSKIGPGLKWIRFCSGYGVEISFDAPVLAVFQQLWDLAGHEKKHAEALKILQQERHRFR